MGGRMARHHALVHGDTRPGDALHERHRRAAVDVRMVVAVLLDHAEDAHRRGVPGHARRHRPRHDGRSVVIDGDVLAADRDHDDQRTCRRLRRLLLGGFLGRAGVARVTAAAAAVAPPGIARRIHRVAVAVLVTGVGVRRRESRRRRRPASSCRRGRRARWPSPPASRPCRADRQPAPLQWKTHPCYSSPSSSAPFSITARLARRAAQGRNPL